MFYDAIPDPYCYPGTSVLRNIPGFTDPLELEVYEFALSRERADQPLPAGYLSVTHYRAIHRHLFQDVYTWAGRFRTVRISKGGSAFCYPEHIAGQMARLFDDLRRNRYLAHLPAAEFITRAAHFLAELNAIHPFREGNGRTQLAFMTLLANRAGHELILERLEPDVFLQAVIRSFSGDEGPLVRVLTDLIMPERP